jgi:hypothetical protein
MTPVMLAGDIYCLRKAVIMMGVIEAPDILHLKRAAIMTANIMPADRF